MNFKLECTAETNKSPLNTDSFKQSDEAIL